MSFDPIKSEWRGVSQIYDKVKNGLYRANATAVVMFFFFLIMYFVVLYEYGPYAFGNLTWIDGLSALFGLPAFVWIIAFFLGYSGAAYVGVGLGGVVENVTPDTNMTPRPKDWVPFSDFSATTGLGGRGTIVDDQYSGRLSVGSEGLDGIIKFPWKDILSVNQVNPQNVSIKRVDRIFGIPIGKRSFELHFDTPEDLSSFINTTSQYLAKKN